MSKIDPILSELRIIENHIGSVEGVLITLDRIVNFALNYGGDKDGLLTYAQHTLMGVQSDIQSIRTHVLVLSSLHDPNEPEDLPF